MDACLAWALHSRHQRQSRPVVPPLQPTTAPPILTPPSRRQLQAVRRRASYYLPSSPSTSMLCMYQLHLSFLLCHCIYRF